jgi:membrane protease YdiL (CAAX protease family)
MQKSLGGFRAALPIGWTALGAAGLIYARAKGIPTWAALPVLAAFLIEYSFYLVPGFESAREWLASEVPELQLGLILGVTAWLPYLAYSLPTHQFHWLALARLAALTFTVSLWYVVLPRAAWADLLFLALLAVVMLRKFFDPIYTPPLPSLRIEVLGQLTLIHVGALSIQLRRRMLSTGFGFLPSRRDWSTGLRYFLLFLPVGFPIALLVHLVHFGADEFVWWKAAGTFFGILWVVALSEEFVFRGLLQTWMSEWTGHPTIALLTASAIFGLCHLGFRAFPNWRMALIAGVAGCFYGRAFQRAGSIRAGMVTHALVVTVWRTVFLS